MKRIVAVLPILLLLCACGTQQQTPVSSDSGMQVVESWYSEADNLHEAIRTYWSDAKIFSVENFKDGILVATERTLTCLSGVEGIPTASFRSDYTMSVCQVLDSGCGCYLPETNEVVFLNENLQTEGRFKLPERPDGAPVFSPDGTIVYYGVGSEIKAYDISLKISRRIKFTTCVSQSLTGIYFDGQLLSCVVEYDSGETDTAYISTKDGTSTHTESEIAWMETVGNSYMLERTEGSLRQLICGTVDGTPWNLKLPDGAPALAVNPLNGVISYADGELSYYDTASGKKTAVVTVGDIEQPVCAIAEPGSNSVWFASGQMLCRWDLTQTPTDDETVYKAILYTRENPDEAALAPCRTQAETMSSTYGIRVLILQDAVETTGDYIMSSEYQVNNIQQALNQLESALQGYPANFLSTASKNGLNICIVRSVSGGTEPVQYWSGGAAYIALPADCDVADGLAMGMGYVINSRVLSASTKLDKWNRNNPKNFEYAKSADKKYLEGDNRSFVDMESMISASEDRSRIFHQAMKPDNAQMFASETMQKKLELFCAAIRDTWGWEESTETYLWEQYLKTPLANKS